MHAKSLAGQPLAAADLTTLEIAVVAAVVRDPSGSSLALTLDGAEIDQAEMPRDLPLALLPVEKPSVVVLRNADESVSAQIVVRRTLDLPP